MLIYVDTPLRQAEKQTLLQGAGSADEVVFQDELPDDTSRRDAITRATVIFGNPPPDWMKNALAARWIQLYSAGFEYYQGIDLAAQVTNMQDYYSQPCAETVVAGILALYRKMDEFAVLKEKKKWIGYPIRRNLRLLHGNNVLLLGNGNIAKRIARILSGFDTTCVYFSRSAPGTLHTKDELVQKIPWADIIIGCLPGTGATRGLFTNEMIDLMKTSAIFCNVGRGNLVADQAYLVDALTSRRIGGAVLDVTTPEPVPADSPLWDCPNTVLSQHSGGGQVAEYDGIVLLFLENLALFREGRPLKNPIHFEKGY